MEQKSDCSLDKQEIALNGEKDATEKSQLQDIAPSDQSVLKIEAINTNGVDEQTEVIKVDKHESLLIADCVVDAIIGAASASGDNIPDVISCTGVGKEDSANKEDLDKESELKSETVEFKMADNKAEVVTEEDWVIFDSNNEKNMTCNTVDVVDSPNNIDVNGTDKPTESKDVGEDKTLPVEISDGDKTEIINEPVVITENEPTNSADPMVASVESESSFEKIDHVINNNTDDQLNSDVSNKEKPKDAELKVNDSQNAEGLTQLNENVIVKNVENLDQNKNEADNDNKTVAPTLDNVQGTKIDVPIDNKTVSKDNTENATIDSAPKETNADNKPEPVPVAVTDPVPIAVTEPVPVAVTEPVPVAVTEPVSVAVTEPVPVALTEPVPVAVTEPVPVAVTEPVPVAVTELPPKPPAVEDNIVSPVATKRKSKLTKQNSETDKTKRDSYQETKQEIQESLSFIKSKLTEPIVPVIPPVEKAVETVKDEGKTKAEEPIETVKEKNKTEAAVESKTEKPVESVKAETKTNKVESKAAASKQDSPKGSTPDYEPISVNDPDPVYESVVESTPSPQENAKSVGKSGAKQPDKVEIIEKTDLSKRQFGVECIPPLRPARTKKSDKMEVPSWKPPEQNIMSYLCGCFMRRQQNQNL